MKIIYKLILTAAVFSALVFTACDPEVVYRDVLVGDPVVTSVSVSRDTINVLAANVTPITERVTVTVNAFGGASTDVVFSVYQDEDNIVTTLTPAGVLTLSGTGEVIVKAASYFDEDQYALITVRAHEQAMIEFAAGITVQGTFEGGAPFNVTNEMFVIPGTVLTVTWEHPSATELYFLVINGNDALTMDIDISGNSTIVVEDALDLELKVIENRAAVERGLTLMRALWDFGVNVGQGGHATTGQPEEAIFRPRELRLTPAVGIIPGHFSFRVGMFPFGNAISQFTMIRVFSTADDAQIWLGLNTEPGTTADHATNDRWQLPGQPYVLSGQWSYKRAFILHGPPPRVADYQFVNGRLELIVRPEFQAQYEAITAELRRLAGPAVAPLLLHNAENFFHNSGRPEAFFRYRPVQLLVNMSSRDNEFVISRRVGASFGMQGIHSSGMNISILGNEHWASAFVTPPRPVGLGDTNANHMDPHTSVGNVAFGLSTNNSGHNPGNLTIVQSDAGRPLASAFEAFLEGNPIDVVPLTETHLTQLETFRTAMQNSGTWDHGTGTTFFGAPTFRHTFVWFQTFNQPATLNVSVNFFSTEAEAIRFYEAPTTTGGAALPTHATAGIRRHGNVVAFTNGTTQHIAGVNAVIAVLEAMGD